MRELDILFLFVFVLSWVFVANQILTIVLLIFSDQPKQMSYSKWDKISNYFFISYLITYYITKIL